MNTSMSSTAHALKYVEQGGLNAARLLPVPEGTQPRPIRSVAVVGAGTIGTGIAMTFANAGVPVTLLDIEEHILDRALERIRRSYGDSVRKGKISEQQCIQRLALIGGTLHCQDIAGADLVIEAVFEDLETKQSVFRILDAVMKEDAILATSTSTLSVNRIAGFTRRPRNIIGLHFFSPANINRLLEVVRGADTADDVLVTAMGLGARLGKQSVVADMGEGLFGNRLLDQYWRQAFFLVEEGAAPEYIDRVMEAWGMAIGPFRLIDLVGNDLHWSVRRRHYIERPHMRYSRLADKLCELGRFGQKVNAGWYRYGGDDREALPDASVTTLIEAHRAEIGVQPRKVDDEEIVERLVLSLVNEGARVLGEGIALRSSDIDTVYVVGYGFPRYRGGPMYYADQMGLRSVLSAMEGFAAQGIGDPSFWVPAPLIVRLAAEGGALANHEPRLISGGRGGASKNSAPEDNDEEG